MNWLASLLASISSYPQNYTITDAKNQQDAEQQAIAWKQADPLTHSWSHIAATGSMRDKFNENSVALLTKSDGSDLKKGDLVIYHDPTKKDIYGNPLRAIHEVADLNDTHFIANGVSNRHYDGWSPRSGVEWKANIIKYPQPTQVTQPAPNLGMTSLVQSPSQTTTP